MRTRGVTIRIGWTPLHWAASSGRLEVVKYLSSRDDVDADERDNYGYTPLNRAATNGLNGYLEVVKYLLSRDDVNVNARNNSGETPLDRVLWRNFNGHLVEVATFLRARGGV